MTVTTDVGVDRMAVIGTGIMAEVPSLQRVIPHIPFSSSSYYLFFLSQAIVRGILDSGKVGAENVYTYDVNPKRTQHFTEQFGTKVSESHKNLKKKKYDRSYS